MHGSADLSRCCIDTHVQRELAKWIRRPKTVLRTLLLHNVRLTPPGTTNENGSSSTNAARQLLRTLRGTRSQLDTLLFTLNVAVGGNARDGAAPGDRVLTQLARAAKQAAVASRSMEIFAFGFCHEDMKTLTGHRAEPGVLSYVAKSITSIGRTGLNAAFCCDCRESDTDAILDAELVGADAAGRPNFDLWLVTAALAHKKTDVLCVRLGNLQRSVALRVMEILSDRGLAAYPKAERKYSHSGQPDQPGDTDATSKDEHKKCLISDACALQDRDMPALDELLRNTAVHDVVVRDNPITEIGLRRIEHLETLDSLGFLTATPVSADIAIALMFLRERSRQQRSRHCRSSLLTMTCTGVNNFEFPSFSSYDGQIRPVAASPFSQLRSFPKLDTAVLKVQQARGIIELNLSKGACRGYSSADLTMLAQLLAFCPNLTQLWLNQNRLTGESSAPGLSGFVFC